MKHLSLFLSLKCSIIIALLFSSSHMAFTQDDRQAKNSLYLELGGNGLLYSINYERLLGNQIGVRVGGTRISFDSFDSDDNVGVTLVNVMTNYFVGAGKHRLELGAGGLALFSSADFDGIGSVAEKGLYGTGTVGYRLQPVNGGFLFKLGFTPIFGKGGFSSWVGMSLGAAF